MKRLSVLLALAGAVVLAGIPAVLMPGRSALAVGLPTCIPSTLKGTGWLNVSHVTGRITTSLVDNGRATSYHMIVRVSMTGPAGRKFFNAWLDTGSTTTVFPDRVLRSLGFKPFGTPYVGLTVGSTLTLNHYKVPYPVLWADGKPYPLGQGTLTIAGIEGDSMPPAIGLDILSKDDLSLNGKTWSLTIPEHVPLRLLTTHRRPQPTVTGRIAEHNAGYEMFVPVSMTGPAGKESFPARLDTGSNVTNFPDQDLRTLGFKPLGTPNVIHTPAGPVTAYDYKVPYPVLWVNGKAYPLGHGTMTIVGITPDINSPSIGLDILSRDNLSLNGKAWSLTIPQKSAK